MSTAEQPPVQGTPASVMDEVSDAMVGLYESEFGRGSTNARTYWSGPDAITCFMEDVTTGHEERVRETRALMPSTAAAPLCQAVERIVGRTVRSLHSTTDAHVVGLATETFVFYPQGREGPSRGLEERHALEAAPGHASAHSPLAPASSDLSIGVDELTPAERATVDMVRELAASGTLGPLMQALRSGEQGLVDARDALRMLVELDREQLVEIALDVLICQYVAGPRVASPRPPDARG